MIRWNDNYITGIEKLDKEHQQLFQMADQVLNKLRERGDEANYRIFPPGPCLPATGAIATCPNPPSISSPWPPPISVPSAPRKKRSCRNEPHL